MYFICTIPFSLANAEGNSSYFSLRRTEATGMRKMGMMSEAVCINTSASIVSFSLQTRVSLRPKFCSNIFYFSEGKIDMHVCVLW